MHTDDAWEAWAKQDPYFSVLTDPRFRSAALTEEAKADFFSSGDAHVAGVMAICRERLVPDFHPHRVLDFGCGVGRLLFPFAQIAGEVVGVDVSSTMLAEARRLCVSRGLTNISLALSDDSLAKVAGDFDLVHTCIVLQHVEIIRGRQLFRELVGRIRPGGCGAIHVTFAWDVNSATFGQIPRNDADFPKDTVYAAYRHLIRQLLKHFRNLRTDVAPVATGAPADPEMQMNFYNLSELYFVLQQAGVDKVHTEMTNHGGALGAFLYFRLPFAAG